MITIEQVRFGYGGRITLDNISFRADPGSTVGLIGPNGSGKSTLLRLLYRALRPAGGTITIDATPVGTLRGRDLATRLAVVAQESPPDTPITVAETVLLGRAPWVGAFQGYSRADRITAAAALARVGARDLADRPFATLSGGERQRVLIARALAQQADHLLLDEPTNHLDIRYQHELLALVRGLDKTTTIVVLHDLNLAARYCDHLVLLDNGRVAAAGRVDEVLTPETLEPVYHIPVRRTTAFGATQLLFGPSDDAEEHNPVVAEAAEIHPTPADHTPGGAAELTDDGPEGSPSMTETREAATR
ncbi:ABC transporter ATP-binding protein [Nocardia coubleae]|uniref:ABC transporter ATP-binding protein n=1 Tax=Nocardia coubleae TaxID=356147 RepID=A0A846WB10_9NOCA|nr:ABC transporter ATP-binding protein [Nocardia coubleae]NKX90461.1 ABC transporter ATP-binding protein [Nocardia coubleae]